MFKKLREKISGWSKKVSDETIGDDEEELIEEPEETHEEAKEEENTQEEDLVEKESEELKNKRDKEVLEEHKEKGFFKKLSGKIKLTEKDFEKYSEELEIILLENNVALETTEKIIETLKEKITKEEISKKDILEKIKEKLKETIKESLSENFDIEEKIKEKSQNTKEPYVILFCGINGTGKTTTIAKISNKLKKEKISSIIAAGDTFRAASIEQLKKHGENLEIKIISSSYGSDPASVGFDAINNAKKNKINCVLIDTAGRIHTDKNLLKEIDKISRVCKPDLKVFVGESITGNDSIEQIKAFNETIGIDAIILTKADIDDKGGTALSLGHIIKKPILYLGTGQDYNDLEKFNKDKFIEKLGL